MLISLGKEGLVPTTIITPDQDAIVSEIEIDAPPARVFKALTDAKELMLWFNNPSCPVKFWNMDARLGGRYSYETRKGTVVVNSVDEFECHGEITEIDPPRLLVYTPGSATGTTTNSARLLCAGNSRPAAKAQK
jgi:uncharacterized protein YndB with AHSA1/START domain